MADVQRVTGLTPNPASPKNWPSITHPSFEADENGKRPSNKVHPKALRVWVDERGWELVDDGTGSPGTAPADADVPAGEPTTTQEPSTVTPRPRKQNQEG